MKGAGRGGSGETVRALNGQDGRWRQRTEFSEPSRVHDARTRGHEHDDVVEVVAVVDAAYPGRIGRAGVRHRRKQRDHQEDDRGHAQCQLPEPQQRHLIPFFLLQLGCQACLVCRVVSPAMCPGDDGDFAAQARLDVPLVQWRKDHSMPQVADMSPAE